MEFVTPRPLDAKTFDLFKALLERDRAHGPHTFKNGTLSDRHGTTVLYEIGQHRPELLQAMAGAVDEHNDLWAAEFPDVDPVTGDERETTQ